MTTRYNPTVFEAESNAWRAYRNSVLRDYNDLRAQRGHNNGSTFVDPSPRSRQYGAAWLAAYRERELHCRRRNGA